MRDRQPQTACAAAGVGGQGEERRKKRRTLRRAQTAEVRPSICLYVPPPPHLPSLASALLLPSPTFGPGHVLAFYGLFGGGHCRHLPAAPAEKRKQQHPRKAGLTRSSVAQRTHATLARTLTHKKAILLPPLLLPMCSRVGAPSAAAALATPPHSHRHPCSRRAAASWHVHHRQRQYQHRRNCPRC